MRVTRHDKLSSALRRLGIENKSWQTPQTRINNRLVSTSRVVVEGMPWLHLVGSGTTYVMERMREVTLVAALTDRIPAVGIVNHRDEVAYVQMPGWAFAALLRMVDQCPSDIVTTVLSDFLPLGPEIPPADKTMGSGIASALEGRGRFSPFT